MRTFLTLLIYLIVISSLCAQSVNRGPYLQSVSSNSIIIKWRTTSSTESKVWFGSSPQNLTQTVFHNINSRNHEVKLENLQANSKYYYAIGDEDNQLAGGDNQHFFKTAPYNGSTQSTKVWVLGDCGTAGSGARNVRNAYYNHIDDEYTDLILLLGDNAYSDGTDDEYQDAIFEVYDDILIQTPIWSCTGNHDFDDDIDIEDTPYLDIFSFPEDGEVGGVPSGTELYYSFDYGNIHFISLDSHVSDRDPGDPMLVWLENDINATTQDWIIAIFHHPPYTDGSHNSNSESSSIDMREHALPILEAGGVDLVMSGHSHSYERSYLLHGHYGYSWELEDYMILNDGNGKPDKDGAYNKSNSGPDNGKGSVYIVTGSAGKVSSGDFDHPAMYYADDRLGSVLIEVEDDQLDLKFIDDDGDIKDYFSLYKNGIPNYDPITIDLVAPTNNSSFSKNEVIEIEAEVSDDNNIVDRVEFYANGNLIGTDYNSPYRISWVPLVGDYFIHAEVISNNEVIISNMNSINIEEESLDLMLICPSNIMVDCNPNLNAATVFWNDPNVIIPPTSGGGMGNCFSQNIDDFEYFGAFNNHQYYLADDPKSWNKAVALCENSGGYLLSIENAGENDFIQSNLDANQIWLGLTDKENEGTFRWVNNQSLNYTNWKPYQPNNSGNEDYVLFDKNDGRWKDSRGEWTMPFIMEVPCPESISTLQLIQTNGPVSGSNFNVGTTLISYYATDGINFQDNCSFTVTVNPCLNNSCEEETIAGFDNLGEYDGKIFFQSHNKAKWINAKSICEGSGGQLAIIENENQNVFLASKIDAINYIGLSDHESEGTFKWVNNSNTNYQNWDEFYPNSSTKEYVSIQPWNGKWGVQSNSVYKRFIMEMPCSATILEEADLEFINSNLNDFKMIRGLELLPNPVSDKLKIRFVSRFKGSIEAKIINNLGEILMAQNFTVSIGRNQLYISSEFLPNGFYSLQLQSIDQLISEKFVKENGK